MTLEEIESLLFQATTILGQAAAGLQEAKKPQQPAQVMSRIAQARNFGAARAPLAIAPVTKAAPRERAYHYLRLASKDDVTNDKIYRVVGRAALAESNRIEAELKGDPNMLTERLDSRQFQSLIHARLKQIREGATGYVGSTQAEDLKPQGTQP